MGNQLDKAFQEDEYEVTLRIRKISRGGQNKRQPERQEQTQAQQVEQQQQQQQQQERQEEEERREAQEQEVHDVQQQDDQQENEEHQQQNQNQQQVEQRPNAGVEEQGEVRTEEMQVNQQRVTDEQSQEQHGTQMPNGGHEDAPANPVAAVAAATAATEALSFWSNGTATTAFMSNAAFFAAAAATTAAATANMVNGFGSPYTPPTTRTSPRKSNLAALNSTSFKRSAATSIGRTRRSSSVYFNAGSNPSVHIRLLKSHLAPWFTLAIPMDFARYHLLEGRLYEIVNGQFSKYLQVEPERHGTYKLNRKLWKHFVREHNLRVGDSIRVEIVGHDQIKVHVFKRCLDLIPYQPTTPVVLPKPEVP